MPGAGVVGGLLNSTLNNLPELIIGGVALANGLAPVVKASLTGAILAIGFYHLPD